MTLTDTLSSRGTQLFFAAFAVIILSLAGCGGGEKDSTPKAEKAAKEAPAEAGEAAEAGGGEQVPEGHASMDQLAEEIQKASHANIKTRKEVNISDEVRDMWKEVELQITDNSSGQAAVVKFEVGSTVQLNDEGLKLHVDTFVPDYIIVENRIETRSNEAKNPAVLVELQDAAGETVTRGWVFRDLPEFNSFTDSRFDVVLVTPAAEEASGGEEGAGE